MTVCVDGDPTVAISNLRLVGCDQGQTFHLLGDDAGAEGVEALEDGLDGLIEARIRTLTRTPVRSDGAILRAVKTDVMDITLELSVSSLLVDESFGEVDGPLREAFSFELDQHYAGSELARLEWETSGGTRWVEVALAEVDYEVSRDPNRRGWWLWTVKLVAYDPFWKSEPVVTPVEFSAPGVQMVEISNPTGVMMRHKWVGTRAQWRIADNSWEGRRWERTPGGLHAARTVLYPALTEVDGGIVVDYDPRELSVRSKFDTNLIGRMPVAGDFPKFSVPEFTPVTEVPVEAVSVPAGGAMIMLVQPRKWRRPWGRV